MMKLASCLCAIFVFFSLSFAVPDRAVAEVAEAPQPQSSLEIILPDEVPRTISLLDLTPLYEGPDETKKTWASLGPQDVEAVQATYDSGYWWVQIHTSWLGDMWIKLEPWRLGIVKPLDADLILAAETSLYDRPYVKTANGASLAPQKVRAKAEFLSPSGSYAIQIETSWLGDQWLIAPAVSSDETKPANLPDAINPDYGDKMVMQNMQILKLGDRSFLQGQLVIEEGAWEMGRIKYGPGPSTAAGQLTFWNASGDIVDRVPYAFPVNAMENSTTAVLLPLHADIATSTVATLEDTVPFYFGLPVPPLLDNSDPEGRVLLGILHAERTGDYTVAKAWINTSGKLPGRRDYRLTLTFYGDDENVIGTARVHQLVGGPHQITIAGKGDWADYSRVAIFVDQVSEPIDPE